MKILVVFLVLGFCSLLSAGQAYDRLVEDVVLGTSLEERQRVISHYLFCGIGRGNEYNEVFYEKALEESELRSVAIFNRALEADIALRLISRLSPEERMWNLQIIAFLKESRVAGRGRLRADTLLELFLKQFGEEDESGRRPNFTIKVVGELESLGYGAAEVDSTSYSFYELIRQVCFSIPKGPPSAYLSYPYIVIEGRVTDPSPVAPMIPMEDLHFLGECPKSEGGH